jgi:proton glutamate symport protein
MRTAIRAIGLPGWVLTGGVLGVAAGVVFGERTAIVAPIGAAYTMLLQIAIFPFLICLLLQGFGRLTPARARRLFAASWPAYVFVCGLTLFVVWLLAQAIPRPPPPVVLRPQPGQSALRLLAMLIPANPFAALMHSDVPAVVVFAIIYGLGIQGMPQRQVLFDAMEAVRAASLKIWNWIVKLSPLGVFALLADTAGKLQSSQLGGFLLYNGLFLAGTLVLALVALPLAVAALAPITYRALLRELRPALLLTLVTTLPVVSLPFLQQSAARLAQQAGCPEDEETSDVVQTSLALSYVLAQVGNYFCGLLIVYAAYAANRQLSLTQMLLMPLITLVSCVGTPSTVIAAVGFMASWLHLPPDTTALWVETSVVTRYGQVLLSVSGFAFITLIVPLHYRGRLRLHRRRATATLAAGGVRLSFVFTLALALRPVLFPAVPVDRYALLTLDPALTEGVVATVEHTPETAPISAEWPTPPSVAAIEQAGVLRVGYNPTVAPFSYFNAHGQLVGYDISFAYQLASDLAVRLKFVPFAWDRLAADLKEDRFDLAMSGLFLTDARLSHLTPGPTYVSGPLAILVRSAEVEHFTSLAAVRARPHLRIAVFGTPAMSGLAHRLLPLATIVTLPSYSVLPTQADPVDGALWTLDQARAWASAHPGWTAVVPAGDVAPLPMAYMLPPNTGPFRAYITEWLSLQQKNGFAKAQHAYWMEGKPRVSPRPRWNLLDAITGR